MGASFSARFLELYSGTFRLFRNPTAHGLVGYSPAEGKAIIGFVNLLLKILKRAEELPPPDMFPENVEKALRKTEEVIGPGAASRLTPARRPWPAPSVALGRRGPGQHSGQAMAPSRGPAGLAVVTSWPGPAGQLGAAPRP